MSAVAAISNVLTTPIHAGGPLELRTVDPVADPAWDALLWTHPHSTFFHTSGWAKTLADAYGFSCHYVAAISGGELLGLLPVMEARSWARGARGVALPFTDECVPLVTPGVPVQPLLQSAIEEGLARRWKFLELRGGHELLGGVPEAVAFHGHTLDLCARAEDTFARFDSPVQRNIRKAERAGLTVEFRSDLEALRAYYELHCRTRTRHGAPPQPFRFFEALCANVLEKGHGFVALARHDGRAVAGAVFFRFARTAIYKFSASDERFQEWRGANLVIWQSIRRLTEAGVMHLDFGKTSLANEGLRRFKRQWGANERRIRYARYDLRRKQFVKIGDMAAGFQGRLFALLPVAVSRWVGRAVYPHLS